MHEAVFEDVFGDGGCAFGLGGEGHELGLHIGREAGVFFGGDVSCFELATAADADVVGADVDAYAALLEFGDECAEVFGFAGIDVEVSAGDGSREEEGASLDAVGVDAVTGTVEPGYALDADGGCSCALNFSAHGCEESGEVGDFGLAGAVLEEGFTFGEGGGHEEVFGAGDGDLVEDNVSALEAALAVAGSACFEIAVFLGDGCAHGFKAFDVQVDWAATDGAASWHGDAGDAGAGDERAEDERAGTHGLDDLVLGDGIGEDGALDVGAVLGSSVA